MNLDKVLPLISRPIRYVNHEWNARPVPANREKLTRLCFCFPDLYDLGGSNLGIEILYHIVNSRTDAYAERVYAPDKDFAQVLRKNKLPLFSLESQTPLKDFHLLGFSLQYELCYTNVLEILNLAGIPQKQREREETFPLIIGGGPCATANPEPLWEFFDLFVLGEGEEVINEIIDTVTGYRLQVTGKDKKQLLRELARIPGVYVPSFYKIEYNSDNTISKIQPQENVPDRITTRKVNLENAPYPTRPIVPYLETVHHRLNIEIMRGCPWACRFCQAGFIYHPFRQRSKEKVLSLIEESLPATGYEEMALSGLSVTDHPAIYDLVKSILERYRNKHLRLSLPSLRCDRFSLELMKLIEEFPQTTLTFAPEAGSERLRGVLKKRISDEEILECLSYAYGSSWRKIKLYFMYGLPTEEEDDLKAIAALVKKIKKIGPQFSLTFTISPFVPKPQTPFQWFAQGTREELRLKKNNLLRLLPGKIRAHSLEGSFLEGIFARGDRRLSRVIQCAWEKGCLFDQWEERLNFSLWEEAFGDCGINPETYLRGREEKEILPWEHLAVTVSKDTLRKEFQMALEEKVNSSATRKEEILGEKMPPPSGKKVLISLRVIEKVRLRFTRKGDLRFLSCLEQIELFRHLFRRANLPLAYTGGFQPQMKVSFGPALPVGYLSESEYVDIELVRRLDRESIQEMLAPQIPPQMDLTEVKRIPTFSPSLDSILNLGEYEILPPNGFSPEEIREKVASFLGKEKREIYNEKKRENIDLSPLIRELKFEGGKIRLFLRFYPKKTVRPELVIGEIFNLPPEETKILEINRLGLYRENPDGSLTAP